jgi:hypothetical protein
MATEQQLKSANEMNLGSFEEKPQPTKAVKKRVKNALKQIAAETGISGPAIGAESVNLSGDTAKLAKQADEKTVRQEFVAKAQANYEFIRKEFREFGKLCEEEDIATSNRIAYFNARILNTDFYRRCQDICDFFATKSPQDYLIGEDGTKYFRAQDIFPAELGVTFQYVSRQMLKYRELYETLTGDKLPQKSNAGGRRTGSTGRSTGSGSSSPAGKVGLDELLERLPEEMHEKVLAQINGTKTTETPIDSPDESQKHEEESALTLSLDDKVRRVVTYARDFARLLSPAQKEEFYGKVIDTLSAELQPPIDVPLRTLTLQPQLTEGDSVAA